ncbi:MAG: hypothetical protein CUN55_15375, partial [Phototrophicales bacterium]
MSEITQKPATAVDFETVESPLLKRTIAAIAFAILIIFALVETVPFVLTIANSFKCLPATRQAPEAFIPSQLSFGECTSPEGIPYSIEEVADGLTFQPTLEGYEGILDFEFERWFANSIIYSVSITVLRVFLDSLAGYALARLKFPGQRLMFFVILGTMMIPGIVLL